MTNLSAPIFHNEDKARAHLEAIRWPDGPFCPHCGEVDNVTRLEGASHRPGLFQCNSCREHFSVTVGTVMERSHIPLHKWVLAFHLMASSKKGISAHQLHRMLGVTYKSAWFMAHRIRVAMGTAAGEGPVGGSDKIVQADETEIALSKKSRKRPRSANPKILTLVERGGRTRSFHLDSNKDVKGKIREHMDPASTLHTDSATYYKGLVEKHEAVDHSKDEWARDGVSTNAAENFFSVFKRGMVGTYQHCDDRHLHRYLAEFDFRQTHRVATGVNDTMRAELAIKGAEGKRLTYRQPVEAGNGEIQ